MILFINCSTVLSCFGVYHSDECNSSDFVHVSLTDSLMDWQRDNTAHCVILHTRVLVNRRVQFARWSVRCCSVTRPHDDFCWDCRKCDFDRSPWELILPDTMLQQLQANDVSQVASLYEVWRLYRAIDPFVLNTAGVPWWFTACQVKKKRLSAISTYSMILRFQFNETLCGRLHWKAQGPLIRWSKGGRLFQLITWSKVGRIFQLIGWSQRGRLLQLITWSKGGRMFQLIGWSQGGRLLPLGGWSHGGSILQLIECDK